MIAIGDHAAGSSLGDSEGAAARERVSGRSTIRAGASGSSLSRTQTVPQKSQRYT